MKRIVLEAKRKFRIEETEKPKPKAGCALVRIRKVGICGSDMHLYRDGRIGSIEITEPFVVGHECMGEVEAVGDGVGQEWIGKRVAIEPAIHCGHCAWCLQGNMNLCPNGLFLGLPPQPGAMQEYLVHPVSLLERLPDTLSDEAAVILEPLSIALHAVRLAKIQPGQKVAVLGTGVIGSSVLMILSLYRGLHIVAVDLISDRLDRAKSLGATETILAEEGKRQEAAKATFSAVGGLGADIVFECAGETDTFWSMCEIAAPGAHLAVIGTSAEDRISFSSGSARRKGLTIRMVRRSLNTLEVCLNLASRGLILPEQLVTHSFPAVQVNQAFRLVENREDQVLKALVSLIE